MGAFGGGLGDLLRAGTAVGSDKALGIGGERVGDVDDDLAASASPYWLTTGTALSNSTARMTISPPGGAHVPAVAPCRSPWPGLRPWPVATNDFDGVAALDGQGADALAMFPEPMMLMLLMTCPVLVGDRKG